MALDILAEDSLDISAEDNLDISAEDNLGTLAVCSLVLDTLAGDN